MPLPDNLPNVSGLAWASAAVLVVALVLQFFTNIYAIHTVRPTFVKARFSWRGFCRIIMKTDGKDEVKERRKKLKRRDEDGPPRSGLHAVP